MAVLDPSGNRSAGSAETETQKARLSNSRAWLGFWSDGGLASPRTRCLLLQRAFQLVERSIDVPCQVDHVRPVARSTTSQIAIQTGP